MAGLARLLILILVSPVCWAQNSVDFVCAKGLVSVEGLTPESGVIVIEDFSRGFIQAELKSCQNCDSQSLQSYTYQKSEGQYGRLELPKEIFEDLVLEFQIRLNGRLWSCFKD